MVWSGIRTRDTRIKFRCSTQLSYPVVDEPESNRRPSACADALPLSYRPRETPSPGFGHTQRQRRAHRTDRKSVPLETVRSMFRIEASPKAPISLCNRSLSPPVPGIEAQRLRASWRSSPADLACPNTGMRIDYANSLLAPFANAQNKTPPDGDPRAFAFLGDRVDRSPRGKSVECGESVQTHEECAGRARARIALFSRSAWLAGVVEEEFHRNVFFARCSNSSRRRMGANLTPAFFELQEVFRRTVGAFMEIVARWATKYARTSHHLTPGCGCLTGFVMWETI